MDQNNSDQPVPTTVIDQSSRSDAAVERKVQELMERESFKKRTKEIISDYVDSVPFMKKVQEYASDEVKKCYSSERYEDFQKAVVAIVHAELSGDEGRKKLDTYVDGRIKSAFTDNAWKNKTFWIPTFIAAAAVVVAIIK